MNYNLYVIYDKVTGVYGDPFPAVNEASAVRRFEYVMKNSPMVSFDCALFEVGRFDSDVGIIESFDKPKFIKNYEVISNE